MKFIIVFACVIALTYGEYKLSKEFEAKALEHILEIVEKCQKQENASDADIAELKAKKEPSTKEGKCMMACFHENFGAQDKEGKFSKEGIIKTLEPIMKEDINLYNELNKVMIDVCLPQVKATDRCDAALEMGTCYLKNASEDLKKVEIW